MYIVIGANGYLGSYIVKHILKRTDDQVLAVGRHITAWHGQQRVSCMQCDITDTEDVKRLGRKAGHMPGAKVVYLAACHHPDEVRADPAAAWDANVTALSNVLNHLHGAGRLLYASTEMVYGDGGIDKKFSEKDSLHPVNLYGVQKKTAEAVVLGYGHHVVRFPFLIGPSILPDRQHFYDVIVETVKNGGQIEMFADAYKSALDFDTAAGLAVRLCESGAALPPVLNIAGDDVLSKYEIALEIVKKHQMDVQLVKPVKLAQDRQIFKERRAGSTLLDNSLLKQCLHIDTVKMKF